MNGEQVKKDANIAYFVFYSRGKEAELHVPFLPVAVFTDEDAANELAESLNKNISHSSETGFFMWHIFYNPDVDHLTRMLSMKIDQELKVAIVTRGL